MIILDYAQLFRSSYPKIKLIWIFGDASEKFIIYGLLPLD